MVFADKHLLSPGCRPGGLSLDFGDLDEVVEEAEVYDWSPGVV